MLNFVVVAILSSFFRHGLNEDDVLVCLTEIQITFGNEFGSTCHLLLDYIFDYVFIRPNEDINSKVVISSSSSFNFLLFEKGSVCIPSSSLSPHVSRAVFVRIIKDKMASSLVMLKI